MIGCARHRRRSSPNTAAGVAFGKAGTIGHETPDVAVEVAGVDQVHLTVTVAVDQETVDKPLAPPPSRSN